MLAVFGDRVHHSAKQICMCQGFYKLKENHENIVIGSSNRERCCEMLTYIGMEQYRKQKTSYDLPLNYTESCRLLATCCAASFKCFCHLPAQRGISLAVRIGASLVRKGFSRSVGTPNEETVTPPENRTNDIQREAVSSERRIPMLVPTTTGTAPSEGMDLMSKGMKWCHDGAVLLEKESACLRALLDQKDDQIKKLEEENAVLKGRCNEHDEVIRKKEAEHKALLSKKEDEHQVLLRKKNNDQYALTRKKDNEIQELQDALHQAAGTFQQIQEALGRRSLFAGQERGKEPAEKHAQRSTSERKGKKRTANEMMDDLLAQAKFQRSMKKAKKTDVSPQDSPNQCAVEPSDEEEDDEQERVANTSQGGHESMASQD